MMIYAVPPIITLNPSATSTCFTTNEEQTLTIDFQSKSRNDTRISWYKDGDGLQNFSIRHDNRTEMVFDPIGRSDRGEYRVVVENSHSIIPTNRRRAETHFTLCVTIQPATPVDLAVERITSDSATLTWSVTLNHEDQQADNQIIGVYYANGSVLSESVVGGDVRRQELTIVPGERYYTQVLALNQDGNTTSISHPFQSMPGGKKLQLILTNI